MILEAFGAAVGQPLTSGTYTSIGPRGGPSRAIAFKPETVSH